MERLPIASQITFLYFESMPEARHFFADTLGLSCVHDTGWSAIYRTGAGAFVGAVGAGEGSIAVTARGGVLVSLCVRDVDAAYARLRDKGLADLTPVRPVKDLPLRSFFFTGPEGYAFEVQQFTDPALADIFQ